MALTQLQDFLLQALEHEKGGVEIYETALKCAVNDALRADWQSYLDETRNHVKLLTTVCAKLGLQSDQETPGRQVVRHIGAALVQAMEMAQQAGESNAAQRVACESVVLAETKCHMNWELVQQCAMNLQAMEADVLKAATEEVEDQEDEHLYHSRGWCRELWIEALGMPAVLPPPEEVKNVRTAIGAAKAEQSRKMSAQPKNLM